MIETTKVSRSLDRKSLIMWLEIIDIFALVMVCSVLNLMFGGTHMKLYLVYLPTAILGITLILTKRGRPDGFLQHFLKFHLRPKHLTCFYSGPESFSLTSAIEKRKGAKR